MKEAGCNGATGWGASSKSREGNRGTQVQSTLLSILRLALLANTAVLGIFLTTGHQQTLYETGCLGQST